MSTSETRLDLERQMLIDPLTEGMTQIEACQIVRVDRQYLSGEFMEHPNLKSFCGYL